MQPDKRRGRQVYGIVGVCVFLVVILADVGLRAQEVFVDFGEEWSFFRGRSEPGPGSGENDWRSTEFDDTGWERGVSGFGYGNGDDTTLLTDMQGSYTTLYLRRRFHVEDPDAVGRLTLSIDYDDGFVCYVNGVEARRSNAGAPGTRLPFDATAGGNHEAGVVETYDVGGGGLLETGENVIAVQGLNVQAGSSDFSLNVRLDSGFDFECPENLVCAADLLDGAVALAWDAGSKDLDSVAVLRDGVPLPGSPYPPGTTNVVDEDAGDFVHTYEVIGMVGEDSCPALMCRPQVELLSRGAEWRFHRGSSAPSSPPDAWREPEFDDDGWEVGRAGFGYSDGDDATLIGDMSNNYLSLYIRKRITLPDLGIVRNAVLAIDYDDGFVCYVNGVEAARGAMGPAGSETSFDQPALFSHEAGSPEQFRIDPSLLREGENVIAIEGHNSSLGSSDFSLHPRILLNICPRISGFGCTPDVGDRAVYLSWNSVPLDSIEVLRNGEPLDGSPFPGTTSRVIDDNPLDRDATYVVQGIVGKTPCSTVSCGVLACSLQPLNLGSEISLDSDGVTRAVLSFEPAPSADTAEIFRNGVLLAGIQPTVDSFVDANVNGGGPLSWVAYRLVHHFADGTRRTLCSRGHSLCAEGLGCTAFVDGGEPAARLSWRAAANLWDSYTVRRDGEIVATGLPGDSTSWVDRSAPLDRAHVYRLVPLSGSTEQAGCVRSCTLQAGSAWAEPESGWDYSIDFGTQPLLYSAESGVTGNIDGNWIRAVNVDSWDGSAPGEVGAAPGGAAPGGLTNAPIASRGLCGEGLGVLRLVDPGDPSSPTGELASRFPEPFAEPNNRALLMGLDTGVPDRNLLRDGVTFAVRWRLSPSAAPVLGAAGEADGQGIADGLGQVGIYFVDDGSLGTEGASAGLAFSLNETGLLEISTQPALRPRIGDVTEFRTLWVTVEDPEGDDSYNVTIYNDDSLNTLFGTARDVVLQDGRPDFGVPVSNFLAIGLPDVADGGDLEIDRLAWARGVHLPTLRDCGECINTPPVARATVSRTRVDDCDPTAVLLDGTESVDGDGGFQGLAYSWIKQSGPGGDSIETPASDVTRVTFAEPGSYRYELRVNDGQSCNSEAVDTVLVLVDECTSEFVRGDANVDGVVAIADPIRLFGFLFLGLGELPCPDAGDTDDNGSIEITDGIRLLGVLFLGQGFIPAPGFQECGVDPVDDSLRECAYEICR